MLPLRYFCCAADAAAADAAPAAAAADDAPATAAAAAGIVSYCIIYHFWGRDVSYHVYHIG